MFDCPPIPPYPEEDWDSLPPPEECGEELVDLAEVAPGIRYDASYLKAGRPGAMDRCLMRKSVARRLKLASELLPEGYSFLVYDVLRPLSVQRSLYEECLAKMKAENPGAGEEEILSLVDQFVAYPRTNPARPAPHTTGGAVDLTLCRDGEELDMGTGFDDTTPRAWTRWLEEHDENPEARDNRRLLYDVMTRAGFASYECEWWHFAYGERLWAMKNKTTPIYGFHPICKE